jgi:hypothetical protein
MGARSAVLLAGRWAQGGPAGQGTAPLGVSLVEAAMLDEPARELRSRVAVEPVERRVAMAAEGGAQAQQTGNGRVWDTGL